MDGYKHYIRVNSNRIVIHRFSDAFEQPQEGDICVATDAGRHYNDPVTNERGQLAFKWDGTEELPRTQAELDSEWAARPPAPETDQQKIARLETENTDLHAIATATSADLQSLMDYLAQKGVL